MKKLLLLTALVCSMGTSALAQDVDDLKAQLNACSEENASLKESLKISQNFVSVKTNQKFTFKFLRAVGVKNDQTVTFYFLISNIGANEELWIDASDFVDENGDSYNGTRITGLSFPTDVPVKVTCKYKGILPSARYVKYVKVEAGELYHSVKSAVEFKDIPISWE